MSAQDGGPAFPFVWQDTAYVGMSLRDWLAGQALIGMLSGAQRPLTLKSNDFLVCYQIADGMLAARAKP